MLKTSIETEWHIALGARQIMYGNGSQKNTNKMQMNVDWWYKNGN